jgi:hypothetical protein
MTERVPLSTARAFEARIDRARRLYREYFTMCFWHWRKDLEIGEADIPAIVKGLRTNGNRQAFLEADLLARQE